MTFWKSAKESVGRKERINCAKCHRQAETPGLRKGVETAARCFSKGVSPEEQQRRGVGIKDGGGHINYLCTAWKH